METRPWALGRLGRLGEVLYPRQNTETFHSTLFPRTVNAGKNQTYFQRLQALARVFIQIGYRHHLRKRYTEYGICSLRHNRLRTTIGDTIINLHHIAQIVNKCDWRRSTTVQTNQWRRNTRTRRYIDFRKIVCILSHGRSR